MRVAVGSTNPVKVAATERALDGGALAAGGGGDADGADGDGDVAGTPVVEAVAVDSGVAEQPRGIAETVAGAENRARRALRAGTGDGGASDSAPERRYDLGVGIEGGVAEYGGLDGLYLVMWAAATDGDRLGRGGGPSIRLPEGIAESVRAGAELGPVMDDRLGEDGVARGRGAAGVLSGGHTDRERALAAAVTAALGPVATDRY